MKRSTNRILVTHVGSLVRPPEVVDLTRGRPAAKPYDQRELDVLDKTIKEAVRLQAETGIDIPSDGEFSKSSFSGYVTDRLTGYENRPGVQTFGGSRRGRDRRRFSDAYAVIEGGGGAGGGGGPVCVGPITYRGAEVMAQDIARFKSAMQGLNFEEAFIPAVGPATVELQRQANEHYRTREEYLFAIAEALSHEYKMIVDAGFILQIDDPRIVTEWDSLEVEPTPEEYRKFAEVRIEALNHALAGLPADRIRYHLCWGSWHGPHTTDIPLREIGPIILKVKCQAISVEAANPRHAWEWRVWQDDVKLPDGMILIPGVIAHTTNCVEHPELVAERLVRYANIVGRENVIASADCGFAQGATTQRVHSSIQWEKFRMLSEGARIASKQLWG